MEELRYHAFPDQHIARYFEVFFLLFFLLFFRYKKKVWEASAALQISARIGKACKLRVHLSSPAASPAAS